MTPPFAVAVHGGAGRWSPSDSGAALDGVRRAAQLAIDVLSRRGSALDAVVAAVVALEDDPLFNAGTGSALNLAGEAEMDAMLMHGADLRCGAVAAIQRVKNPILVARKVMEDTDHVMLVGVGAQRFARELGFADHDPVTEARRRELANRRQDLAGKPSGAALARTARLLREHPTLAQGTVGAVALDGEGRLAAATSTGGITAKLPGRVGDSPVPGAGTYATDRAAASATGHGEAVLRATTTRFVCDLMASGYVATDAVARGLERVSALGAQAGLIALDARGRIGIGHTSASMPHAHAIAGEDIVTRMNV